MSKASLRKPRLTEEQRADFNAQADYTSEKPGVKAIKSKKPTLSDEKKRTFRAVNVGMNEIEWNIFKKACKESGQSDVSFFRTAMLKQAKAMLKDA